MEMASKHLARGTSILASLIAATFLTGCSSVGPGFKNHPADCALGIPWDDCLPGTNGYANGGGKLHRDEAAKVQAENAQRAAALKSQCEADYQANELDPIRKKVQLMRESFDEPPPFEIATNDSFPTNEEKSAIAKWATLREACIKRSAVANPIPATATPLQVTFIEKDRAFLKEGENKVGELMVSLYQQKLTYGEFARKRYEITRDAAAAERQFRESTMLADMDRQMEAQRIAQQQFQNNLAAWAVYTQSVAARQPQTVRLDGTVRTQTNCTSQRFGNTVSTNCF